MTTKLELPEISTISGGIDEAVAHHKKQYGRVLGICNQGDIAICKASIAALKDLMRCGGPDHASVLEAIRAAGIETKAHRYPIAPAVELMLGLVKPAGRQDLQNWNNRKSLEAGFWTALIEDFDIGERTVDDVFDDVKKRGGKLAVVKARRPGAAKDPSVSRLDGDGAVSTVLKRFQVAVETATAFATLDFDQTALPLPPEGRPVMLAKRGDQFVLVDVFSDQVPLSSFAHLGCGDDLSRLDPSLNVLSEALLFGAFIPDKNSEIPIDPKATAPSFLPSQRTLMLSARGDFLVTPSRIDAAPILLVEPLVGLSGVVGSGPSVCNTKSRKLFELEVAPEASRPDFRSDGGKASPEGKLTLSFRSSVGGPARNMIFDPLAAFSRGKQPLWWLDVASNYKPCAEHVVAAEELSRLRADFLPALGKTKSKVVTVALGSTTTTFTVGAPFDLATSCDDATAKSEVRVLVEDLTAVLKVILRVREVEELRLLADESGLLELQFSTKFARFRAMIPTLQRGAPEQVRSNALLTSINRN